MENRIYHKGIFFLKSQTTYNIYLRTLSFQLLILPRVTLFYLNFHSFRNPHIYHPERSSVCVHLGWFGWVLGKVFGLYSLCTILVLVSVTRTYLPILHLPINIFGRDYNERRYCFTCSL